MFINDGFWNPNTPTNIMEVIIKNFDKKIH